MRDAADVAACVVLTSGLVQHGVRHAGEAPAGVLALALVPAVNLVLLLLLVPLLVPAADAPATS